MDILRATVLKKEINRQLKEMENDLIGEIVRGCEDADSTEEACAKMIRNAVGLSITLSTGLILDMLIENKIVDSYDEDRLRKNILSVVK